MVKNTSKRRTAVTSNDTQKVDSANDHQNSDATTKSLANTATNNTNIDGDVPSSISANNTTNNSINPPSAAGTTTAQSFPKNNIDGHQPSNNNNDNIAMGTSTTDIPTNAKNDNAPISNSQISSTGSLSAQASIATNSQTATNSTSDGTSNSNNNNNNNEGLSDRQQKIIASIKHRKLLLQWVKVSRIECERLASEYNNSTSVSGAASGDNLAANTTNGQGSASNGNKQRVSFITEMINSQPPSLLQSTTSTTSISSSTAANLNDDISLSSTKEIQNYQTLTKIATNHTSSTKKQQYRLPSSKLSPSSKVGKRGSTGGGGGGTNNRSLPTKANRNNSKLPNVPLLGKQLQKQGSAKNIHQQNTSMGASSTAGGGGVGGAGGGEESKKKKGRKRKSTTTNNNTEGIISLPGGMLSNKNNSTSTKGGNKTKSTSTGGVKGNKNSGKGAKGQLQQPTNVPSATAINLLIRKDVLLSKLNDVLVDRENKRRRLLQQQDNKEKEGQSKNKGKGQEMDNDKGQCELQKSGDKEQSEGAKLLQQGDVRNEGMNVDAAEGSNIQPQLLTTSKSTDDLAAATANIMSNNDDISNNQNDTTTTTTTDKKKFQGPLNLRGPSSLETSIIKATDATLSQINNELLSKGSIEISQIASSSSSTSHKSSIGSMYQRLYNKSTSTSDPTKPSSKLQQQQCRLPIRNKTIWDNVLEEMKWMAIDYVEERKWKVAMSKSLCNGVKKQVRENRKKISSPSKRITTPGGTVRSIGTTPESTSSNRSRSKSRSLSILSQNDIDPIYIESTKEDISNIKKVSRLLSVSILDHWDTSISGGASAGYAAEGGMGSERFRKLRSGALAVKDTSVGGDENADNNNSAMDIVKSDTGDTSTAEAESPIHIPPTYKQLTNDEISTHITKSIEHINKLKEQTNNLLKKEKALQKYKKSIPTIGSNGEGKGVELDNGQLCAVHFLESLWNEKGASTSESGSEKGTTAAIVGGRFGSGKTLAVCTLLWKNSVADGNSGPQLVVCSPAALVRWKHELTKFDGLKPHVYGLDSRGNGNEYDNASDVVICDYTSLMKLASNQHQQSGKGINFSSMILDLRHPSSASSPIGNVKWWISLNKFILKCPSRMNRLVFEQTDLPQNCFFHPLDEQSTGKKRIDEMLAMKLAFLYHPSIFFAERGSIGKRIISWAKGQAKAKTDSPTDATAMVVDGEDGNVPNGNGKASVECRSVLISSLQGMVDNLIDVTKEDEVENNSHAWEVHTCTLGRSQQVAYDQCATTLIQGDYEDEELAHRLMRLRKICIHSNLDDVTASLHALSNSRGSISATIGSILVSNSTTFSESNIDLAKSVIKQSSKMKTLLHALITECGHTVAMKHELMDTQTTDDGADNDMSVEQSSSPTKKSRVLILATLVEAQLLTSFFLSAVGLHHEVLVSSSTGGDGPKGSGSVQAWGQDILSRFNGGVKGAIDILITSPKSVSSQSGGMSVTSADVVISIDEDWSGREALHITSILSKIRRQESSSASGEARSCRFIKLICKNTCEDMFICQGNTTTNDVDEVKPPEKKTTTKRGGKAAGGRKSRKSSRSSKSNQDETKIDVDDNSRKISILKVQKPVAHELNDDGFLIPPPNETSSEKSNEHIFGANVVRHRNSKMSSVLGLSSNEESNDMFLPAATGTDSGESEGVVTSQSCNRDFAWALFSAEDNASNQKQLAPASSSLFGSKSVQSYVESFGRSSSFTSQAQSGMPLRLWDVQAGDKVSASNEDAPQPEASNVDDEVAQIDTNNPELLVYRQQKKSNVDLEVEGGDRPSVFSQSFSSFSGSESIALQDGNEGSEPTLYFPSFLPSLLQVSQHLMTSLPQEGLSGMKRKAVQGDIDKSNKKFKVSSSSSSSAAVTLFSDAFSLQKKSVKLPPFSFTVDTNPYSFKGNQNDMLGNAELNFHRKLLSSDLRGALSCQNQPSLNSMLLIIKKKEQPKSNAATDKESAAGSNNNGKKSHKKVKKQQLLPSSNSLPQDKSLPAYFGDKYLKPQSYSAREGLKISFTGSLMGRVRHQNRMNDLVSNSFTQSDGHKPAVLGTIPRASGVQASQLPKTLSSSLEETTVEPWTSKEDSILQKCVSRYGMNWQLAAYAVSSGESFSSTPRIPERVSRRSASQCQSRWLSLETIDHVLDSLPSIVNISDVKVLPRSGNNGQGQESIMCNIPSSPNKLRKEPVLPPVWLDRSNNPPVSPIKSSSQQQTKEKSENVLRRAKMLKEASKKRRVVTVPIPSSGHTHPSHSDAVQAARSSMQASGLELPRREMWPIELLEFRKKQKEKAREDEREARRARAAAAAEAAAQSSSSSQSQQAPQHQQQRQQQQSSVQYRPAPTQNTHHPTQQQMMYAHGQQQQVAYHHPRGAPAVVHHASTNVIPNATYQQPRAPPQQHPPQETKRI